MKVTFVSPSPHDESLIQELPQAAASWPPLGILYMATILQEKGVDVSVIDQSAKGFSVKETVEWIGKENPDILGFSTFSTSGKTAAAISEVVKRNNPNATIIFGSYYATFNPTRILRKYPHVDIIARGEGDQTIVDLYDCLEKGGNLETVSGITFREGNSIKSTPDRPLIENLDSLPFPDRSLLDTEYHSNISGADIAISRFTSITSSRGCVYRCRFCSCQKMARGRWRPRSVEDTLKELCYLESEGYKQLIFVDDSFTLDPKRTIDLCKNIRKESLDLEWICEGRVDSSSYSMYKELSRAGCRLLYLGIESTNQRILKYYNKQTTPQQCEKAVKTAKKAGIDVIIGTFILGAPDESKKEISNTLKFARKIPIDVPQFNVLAVHPGMEIWNELKMKGLLDEERYWETGVRVTDISPNAVPYPEIKKMIKKAVYEFALRPSFILEQMMKTIKSQYRLRVLMNNLTNIPKIRKNITNLL